MQTERLAEPPTVDAGAGTAAPVGAAGARFRFGRHFDRLAWIAGALAVVLVAAVAIGEAMGWPFLAGPVQHWLAHTLDRRVAFAPGAEAPSQVRVRLLGSLRLSAGFIEIGAPAWSDAPHMLQARDALLVLGYGDLWRAHRGEPLRIRELRAATLDGRIERQADGRASWQFGPHVVPQPEPAVHVPAFDLLRIGEGTLAYRDGVLGADLLAHFSLTDRSGEAVAGSGANTNGAAHAAFRFDADGHFQQQPLAIEFASSGVLDVVTDRAQRIAWPVRLDAKVGNAGLSFRGTATDPLKLTALQGRFEVHGPSLAAIGDPLGITLPTTGAFRADGVVVKQGEVWNTVVDHALVGSSRLNGAFAFDAGQRVPMLSGRLRGTRLLLADLGPAVGAAPRGATAPQRPRGRTLPDRPFDLPSLRAMNANVLIDIDDLDLGSSLVEPLRPLHTQLVLRDGVLVLRDLDARTGLGSLTGTVQLDGRAPQALWQADLRWRDVRLERWLRQARQDADAPPYIKGRLNGAAQVTGQGASTAAILGSLRGSVRMQLVDASVSHLAIEAAGLDLAQALGVLVKGDDALPVECGVADLAAEGGVLRPRVLVLDTCDSTVWGDGTLSLAGETMDLRLLVSPKDFSPLALRTPVRLRGTFAAPDVSIEKRPLAGRVGAAALLALVNPIAAVLPFFDTGGGADDDGQRSAQACKSLAAKLGGTRAAARPAR